MEWSCQAVAAGSSSPLPSRGLRESVGDGIRARVRGSERVRRTDGRAAGDPLVVHRSPLPHRPPRTPMLQSLANSILRPVLPIVALALAGPAWAQSASAGRIDP